MALAVSQPTSPLAAPLATRLVAQAARRQQSAAGPTQDSRRFRAAASLGVGCTLVAGRGSSSRIVARGVRRAAATVAMQAARPLPDAGPLPAALLAKDGLVDGAPPEDVFTWDTVSSRMPKIMDSVVASLPEGLKSNASLRAAIEELQADMREGKPLKLLEQTGPFVNADSWNEIIQEYISRGEGWHDAPWWVVENYMYKRLLQELARTGEEGAKYDPFTPSKEEALVAAMGALESSLSPLMDLATKAESGSADEKRAALDAAVMRSLWGNQADLSLSAGKVTAAGKDGGMVSDNTSTALDLLEQAAGKNVVIVLDNHGLEVLCDLVLADTMLRLTEIASVTLHVKDSPVFVSDVTEADVPRILEWLDERHSALAGRLRGFMAEGRLSVFQSPYYTSCKTFWELTDDVAAAFKDAAVVILKGDANYRRLLGDLHWPYGTDFAAYARSFWPSTGLVCLRTMKSGVAIGISQEKQASAKAERPNDWLTCGVFGQVLAAGGCGK